MISPGDIPLPLSSLQVRGQTPTPTATNAYVGQILVVVPAGSTSAVPYTVTGSQFYSIAAQAQEVNLSITANAVALDPATVVSNANFCVGQNVSFALAALPAGVTATNFHWTLGGTFVNESNQPSASSSSQLYQRHNFTNECSDYELLVGFRWLQSTADLLSLRELHPALYQWRSLATIQSQWPVHHAQAADLPIQNACARRHGCHQWSP